MKLEKLFFWDITSNNTDIDFCTQLIKSNLKIIKFWNILLFYSYYLFIFAQ